MRFILRPHWMRFHLHGWIVFSGWDWVFSLPWLLVGYRLVTPCKPHRLRFFPRVIGHLVLLGYKNQKLDWAYYSWGEYVFYSLPYLWRVGAKCQWVDFCLPVSGFWALHSLQVMAWSCLQGGFVLFVHNRSAG